MSQNEVKHKRNNSRPRRAGERSMGRAGNWELISHDYGISLNKLDHGCWHGTPGFPVEELAELKACVELAIQTHCYMVATDTINRLIEEGMVEEKVVDGETHVRLTKKGKEATGSDRTNAATFDDEERFRINGQKDCPECGDKLGSVSNQQCCLESIFRNIVDEGIEKQIAKGKEPCVWHEDVKEEIGRRVHPDILIAKGMEEEDVDSEVGDE